MKLEYLLSLFFCPKIKWNSIEENIKSILQHINCEMNSIVKCSIFLSNMNDFKFVNEVYEKYFSEPYPARETVAVSTLPKNVNIEISAIAICN